MNQHETQRNDPMNEQVARLLSGVSLHGDQHLTEVSQDLVQMDVLLDEAIKKLCTSFMAIHQALAMQQEVVNNMLTADVAALDHGANFKAIHEELNRHVGAAVTGLQFQDMTSQLIRRMVLHLDGLREVFGALAADDAALAATGREDLLTMLGQIRDRVNACCSDLAAGVRSTVSQRHMESGDIELF